MKLINSISLSLILANVGTVLVRADECVSLGQFNLRPTGGSNFNKRYTSATNVPFSTSGSTICEITLKSNCDRPSSGAPRCDWEIDLKFNKGEACNASRASRREGKIFASGKGPAAYTITSGTGDFSGASGKLDSVFDTRSFFLNNFRTVGQICYDSPGQTSIETGGCCSWNVPFDCGASPWCDGSRDRCENNCNGVYIDPSNPPQPKGCCSWNGSSCGSDNWCNFSQSRCEGPCNGSYI